MSAAPTASASPAVLLFDGVCNLCNGFVAFVIARDRGGYFHFASLQSPPGRELLERHALPSDTLESVVLVEGERVYTRSDAVLRVVRRLGGAWPLLTVFRAVPRPLRDATYEWVAAHRYRWFGRREECMLPTPELLDRFLE